LPLFEPLDEGVCIVGLVSQKGLRIDIFKINREPPVVPAARSLPMFTPQK
jgi:hypothetical protein